MLRAILRVTNNKLQSMTHVSLKADHDDYVVLLHGLGRDPRIMKKLEEFFKTLGYHVYSDHYQSTKHSVEELAGHVWKRIRHACPDTSKKINIIGHSLGAIITRVMLAKNKPENIGRVVMIAPPNKGTEVVDFLKRFKFYLRKFGPAGQQLHTGSDSIVHQYNNINYELGIIAGNRSVDPFFSWFILKGEGDGKVTIESTKLAGMKDHIIVPASHKHITNKDITAFQAAHFIKYGAFRHETE